MQTHFNLVNDILKGILKEMLYGLREGLKESDTIGAFPNKDRSNPVYPAFEIFAYLLFRLDFLAMMHQEQKLRMPLFNFIADKMLETLDIEKGTFNSTLNKRMEEYGGILVDWNRGEITYELRNKKLLQGFLDNLTYAISKQDSFSWEGKIKPLPWTDANEVLIMHIIFKEMLLPIEIRFRRILRSIFTANPDFTQLSTDKLEEILLQMEQDISS